MDLNAFWGFLGQVISAIFALAIGKYIYDWYNETAKRNRLAKAQLRLLTLIAAAQAVNVDTIADMVAESKANFKPEKNEHNVQ